MILIDTDVLVNLFDLTKPRHAIADKAMADLLKDDISLYVSIVTAIEFIQGSKSGIEKNKVIQQLQFFQNFAVTEQISLDAKELIIKYSSSNGLLLGDSLIAATALYLDIPLFTFNKKDFKFIKYLKLYEPS